MASSLIGAGVSAIGSFIGAGKQQDAIKKAAALQSGAATTAAATTKAATDAANTYTEGNFNDVKTSEAPYQAAGAQALSQLSAGTADGGVFNSTPTGDQVLAQDPGYAFRQQQGELALQRAEAAGGGVGSGGALKAGVQYGQDYASNEYANASARFMANRQANYSNLSNLASGGQTANQVDASAGTAASANVANTTLTGTKEATGYSTDAANAQAAGLIGVGNSQAAALSSLGGIGNLAGSSLSQSGYGSGGPNPYTPTFNPADGSEVYGH